MKIFVDESFQAGSTTLAAIKISDQKVIEAKTRIRVILNKHKTYNKPDLKMNYIRNNYPKRIQKNINKILNSW